MAQLTLPVGEMKPVYADTSRSSGSGAADVEGFELVAEAMGAPDDLVVGCGAGEPPQAVSPTSDATKPTTATTERLPG